MQRCEETGLSLRVRGLVVFFTGAVSAAACSSCGYFFVLGQIKRHGCVFTVSVNSLMLVAAGLQVRAQLAQVVHDAFQLFGRLAKILQRDLDVVVARQSRC